MTTRHTAGIFVARFPFTDLSGAKLRPVLALADPDQRGDIPVLFITSQTVGGRAALADPLSELMTADAHFAMIPALQTRTFA